MSYRVESTKNQISISKTRFDTQIVKSSHDQRVREQRKENERRTYKAIEGEKVRAIYGSAISYDWCTNIYDSQRTIVLQNSVLEKEKEIRFDFFFIYM